MMTTEIKCLKLFLEAAGLRLRALAQQLRYFLATLRLRFLKLLAAKTGILIQV